MDDTATAVPNSNVPEPETELLKWTAPSRLYKSRDRQFFTTAMAVAVLFGIILIFAGEWMLIAVIAAMIFAYYIWSTVPPEDTQYAITNRGLRVGGQLHRWSELSQWWIEEKWGQKIVVVDAPLALGRRLHLVLSSQVPEERLTQIMSKYLVMEAPLETPMDRAGKWVSEKFPLDIR